jgi:threonine synthase
MKAPGASLRKGRLRRHHPRAILRAMSFVSHIECTVCGQHHDAKQVLSVCARCGQMLAVRYDLDRVKASVTKEALRARPPGMYRFRELTPLAADEDPVTLGEGGTPLFPLPRLAAALGLRHLWGKDEGQNPTGSFKARGLGMAITKARTLGARGFIIPSAGNAGGAAAVYAARCGLPCAVIVPRGTPPAAVAEAAIAGATVFTVEGSIATAGKVVGRVAPQLGWFDLSTLKEPYRLEGKKTMGLELAEQLGWTMPDVLLYPTGGGTGLIGIPKGYEELRAMGWLSGPLPRVVAVQAEHCAPVVKAFHEGAETTAAWENPTTHAAGLRVPSPFAGRQMLRILRDTRGDAVAVSEEAIRDAQRRLARLEGIWTSPEGAALVAALALLRAQATVGPETRVVLVLTGAGIKYDPPALPPPIDLTGSDDAVVATVVRTLGAR